MRLRLPLQYQVLLSYVPVVLIPILVIGLITRAAAERGLTVLVTEQGLRRANQLAPRFAEYYQRQGSWEGVNRLFEEGSEFAALLSDFTRLGQGAEPAPIGNPQANPPGRPNNAAPPRFDNRPPPAFQPQAAQIILADPGGNVLAANTPDVIGGALQTESLVRGVPIFYQNRTVGVLVVSAALGVLDEAEREVLAGVNSALLAAALISASMTVVIGLWLSGQISAPVAALMRGVKGLAGGQWSKPLPVYADNELGALTQAFNQMADDLTRQQAIRRQLIADIAHDLRTPLSVMALEIEGIKAGLQTPESAAQSLQEEVEWLSQLVNDLHTLTLIDAGQLSAQPEPTDLTIFLESVYKHWRAAAEGQGRQFALELIAPLPVVNIDPARMRQVLGNLIQNAIQHTPSDATITLRAEVKGQQTFIRVIDTGQGIPVEALPHIFERFYRLDKSRSRSATTGSGLGLSIAHQLTALQGGELAAQSAVGRGTVFSIRLEAVN